MFVTNACVNKSSSKNENVKTEPIDSVIRMKDVLSTTTQIALSEICNSISYVKLPAEESIRDNPAFTLNREYIYHSYSLYKWDGSFVKRVVKQGQGSCEDTHPHFTVGNNMYSLGTKIIVYDNKGDCTGKEHRKK